MFTEYLMVTSTMPRTEGTNVKRRDRALALMESSGVLLGKQEIMISSCDEPNAGCYECT